MSWFPTLFGMSIEGLARFHNRHPGQFIHLKRDVLTAPTGGHQFIASDTTRDGNWSVSEHVSRQNYVRCETADRQPGGTMSWFPALFEMPIGGLVRFHNRHSGQFTHLIRDALTAPAGGYQFTAGDTIRDGKRSASEQVGRQNYVRCETADGQPGGDNVVDPGAIRDANWRGS